MARTTARRILQSVLASEWAIRPEWLQQFAGIATRLEAEGSSQLTAEAIRAEIRRALGELSAGRDATQALAHSAGDRLGDGYRATVRDGVAIVPVVGPLYHYAGEFDDVCGCSSYEQLARDFAGIRDAHRAGVVHSVLLEVDSPGGEVGGCAEAASMIRELAGVMPVEAYVADLGCSAAYWLSSAAQRIHASRTSLLGSIGVVAAFRAGGKTGVIEIVSSQSPKKRPDVQTEQGRAQIQETVDALGEVFVADVAANRGVSVDRVLADFGQGDVLVGQRAVAAGLADDVGTFEGVLARLVERAHAAHRGTAVAGGLNPATEEIMADQNTPAAASATPAALTAETVALQHPAIAETLRAEGATAERARVTGILALARTDADRAIAMQCVESGATKGDAAERILAARDDAGQREANRAARHLAAMQADENELDVPAPGAEPAPNTDEAQVAAILNAGKVPASTR